MLRKLAGFSLSLLSTVVCFILFQLIIRGEKDTQMLFGGGFFIVFYASPFILVGAISSYVIDKYIKRFKMLWYIFLGWVISLIVILLFGLYKHLDAAIFVFLTCIIGAVIFLWGSSIKGKLINYGVGLGIPILLLVLMYFL